MGVGRIFRVLVRGFRWKFIFWGFEFGASGSFPRRIRRRAIPNAVPTRTIANRAPITAHVLIPPGDWENWVNSWSRIAARSGSWVWVDVAVSLGEGVLVE